GEDDPAKPGHPAGDHEDQDPDQLDVDAGATGGFGVASDRVDVTAEGRPAGDIRAEDDDEQHDQPDERHPASVVADRDGRERETAVEGDANRRQERVAGRKTGAATA